MKRIIFTVLTSAAAILTAGCSNAELPSNSSAVSLDNSSADDSSSAKSSAASSSAQSSAASSSAQSSVISSLTQSSAASSSVQSSASSSLTQSSVVSSLKPISSSKTAGAASSSVNNPVKLPEVFTETDELTGGKLEADLSYAVKSGETLCVRSGETLLINGRLFCLDGGNIVVEEGGSLMINGLIELSGGLRLMRGGELLLSGGAKIYGGGSVSVSSFNDIVCEGDLTARIVPPTPVTENGITTVGDVLLVNKKYSLPRSYGSGLISDAVAALNSMRADSGFGMPIVSGFRSYDTQAVIFANYCARDGEEKASTYSARPGQSEHQSGLAMDISSFSQSYDETPEGGWIAENCYKYGFIVRYPKGKDNITGYMYEPWHLRYLGKSTAKLVHDSGLTLEEFLGTL